MHTCVRLLAIGSALLLVTATHADPQIRTVSPPGLQIGAETMLVIEGSDLGETPRIMLGRTRPRQKLVGELQANRFRVEVSLPESTSPGIQLLRVATNKGVSNALPVSVDQLVQQAFSNEVETRPVALHGALTGTTILETTITGEKGERLLVEVESQRLGAKLRPVLRCQDAAGKQLAWSGPRPKLGGDTRLELTLPEDGSYRLQLHDMTYSGPGPGHFRLKMGPFAYADLVFPLGVQRGSKVELQYLGSNLPAGTETDCLVDLAGPPLNPAPVSVIKQFSGTPPRIWVSELPELVEATNQDAVRQLPDAPVAINGRISQTGEEDRYQLPAKAGSKLRIDVVAHQMGSPLDGVLVIRDGQGRQLAASDDQPGTTDPGLDFTVPQGTDALVIGLRDLMNRGGPDFVYRLGVDDASRSHFDLALDVDRVNIPAGSARVLQLKVTRKGYSGPIRLQVPGLPDGITLTGTEIPSSSQVGLLGFAAEKGVSAEAVIRIVGSSDVGEPGLHRAAIGPETPTSQHQPWIRAELGLGTITSPPLAISWKAPPQATILPGAKIPLSVSLTRAANIPGEVRLRLVTTQVMPKKKVKKDNKEETVDDVERALRLEGEAKFGADTKDAVVQLLVPADLPPGKWGLTVVAELMSADGKTVVAAAATSVVYLESTPARDP
jgi:hypothetical protein